MKIVRTKNFSAVTNPSATTIQKSNPLFEYENLIMIASCFAFKSFAKGMKTSGTRAISFHSLHQHEGG